MEMNNYKMLKVQPRLHESLLCSMQWEMIVITNVCWESIHDVTSSHDLLSIWIRCYQVCRHSAETLYIAHLHGGTHYPISRANKKILFFYDDCFYDQYGLYQTSSKKRIRLSKSNWLRYFYFSKPKVTLRWMDTRLRFEYASAQLYARRPEEGNLSVLTIF